MKRPLIVLMLSVLALSGCGEPQPGRQPELTPGQAVFLNNCATCHMGPGDPPGPNSQIMNSRHLASEEEFARFVRNPGTPMMPPFDEQRLSEAQLKDLYGYITSLKQK